MSTEKFVLNNETCLNLISILKSNDVSNLDVAEETIRYIDVEQNLPYLLIMFKESGITVRETVFIKTINDQLNSVCKVIKFDNANQSITYDEMFQEIMKHKPSPESIQFFLDRYAFMMKDVLKGWGFSFLDFCDMKLTMK